MAVRYVSSARLRPYLQVCEAEETAIELHNEALLLGASVSGVIALIEIAMRNRLHQQIGTDFLDPDWLTSGRSLVPILDRDKSTIVRAEAQAKDEKIVKLSSGELEYLDKKAFPRGVPQNANHKTVQNSRRKQIDVSEGEVVANITLGFWKRLFAPEYERTLWKRSTKRLFPNKTLERSTVSRHMETIHATRNRLAHHEPVFGERLKKAMEAIEFVRLNLDSRYPDENGPLCVFTEVQYRNLIAATGVFENAWERLAKPFPNHQVQIGSPDDS